MKLALNWWTRAMDAGSTEAPVGVGYFYKHGLAGLQKDYAKAVELFEKSAGLGNSYGYYNLGLMYSDGLGVAKDPNKAAQLLRTSADKGNPWAPHALGLAYKEGVGVTRDRAAARRWFKLGIERGSTHAEIDLARMYYRGEGGARDDRAALDLIRKGVARDEPHAINFLGVFHETGRGGVSQDRSEAIRLYRKAAALGYETAEGNLHRLGVPAYDPVVIQQLLTVLGYDPGPIDGKPGRKTRTAIKAFQRDRGLTADGKPSSALLAQLRKAVNP